ncbi:MAG: hypothetical protein GX220_07360 [Treponema sp.]|nr:hypothetical protein [Treponema sp.]
MRLHFYKLHIGGNSFVLIDDIKNIKPNEFEKISISICSRRFGIGASGCIFFDEQNNLRIYNHRGEKENDACDALICAARFAFDSGKINRDDKGNKKIIFNTNHGEKTLDIISSREFKLNLGTPFSFISGNILSSDKCDCMDTFLIDDKPICVSAIHLIENNIVILNPEQSNYSFFEFYLKMQKSFQRKKIYLTFARSITKETISVRTLHHGLSTVCTSSACALISSFYANRTNKDAVCIFEHGKPNLWTQQNKLREDKDNSRKLSVFWDTKINEVIVIGTGGYLFEGFFDYEEINA